MMYHAECQMGLALSDLFSHVAWLASLQWLTCLDGSVALLSWLDGPSGWLVLLFLLGLIVSLLYSLFGLACFVWLAFLWPFRLCQDGLACFARLASLALLGKFG